MSAIGTKRTCLLHRTCPLLGVKRTWLFALQMSAFDPKRTLAGLVTTPFRALPRVVRCPVLSLGEAMRRRNKTGGKAAKTQRRKTLSRRNAPKSARNRRSSAARQETEVARLTRELHEFTRAAGGDFGSSGRDQFFARRAWACLRGHIRKRHTYLRWQTCQLVPLQ